jgi:hypothetical protein
MCRSTGALADLHLGTCLFPAWLPGTRNTLRPGIATRQSVGSDRPHNWVRALDHARGEILRCSATHFDPAVVEECLKIPSEVWEGVNLQNSFEGRTAAPNYASGNALTSCTSSVAGWTASPWTTGFGRRQRYWAYRSRVRPKRQEDRNSWRKHGRKDRDTRTPRDPVHCAAGVRPQQVRRPGQELGRSDSRFSVRHERARETGRHAGQETPVGQILSVTSVQPQLPRRISRLSCWK